MSELIAVSGRHLTLVWAEDREGSHPGLKFYQTLSAKEEAQMNGLFRRLADMGRIDNREHFKRLGKKAKREARSLWEFKKFQLRFFGDYRPGKRFVVATGYRKKRNRLSPSEIERALQVLREHDLRAETPA